MTPYVIVATKGRAAEVAVLFDHLAAQSTPPRRTLVVGAGPADVAGLADHPRGAAIGAEILMADKAGLPIQRNVGLDRLAAEGCLADADAFVVFFDDDFRPAGDWLQRAGETFAAMPEVVGFTGLVLADGIKGPGLTEAEAGLYLSGQRPGQPHWATGTEPRDLESVYGCNMAWRAGLVAAQRFDERLPLYAWQEDRDYTGQALKRGRVIFAPACRGVHLGVKGARSSGVRLGYSQIANPIYLAGKGSMRRRDTLEFVARSLLSNIVKSLIADRSADFPGRCRGNWVALRDLATGSMRPERILDL
ncbi:glycosyl transferase [Aureimonas endophytica]|uniref:Glycosyl transferase n=1 Tax=Aureimonas endophytica TaxID=2027858 RepID=A0A917E2U4_9HYPH|nr:glycosyltransferase family A protein [Aureimonas endophytica]GGD95897.1 glycosyl transferase [Aureimonas endophytica]